MNRLGRNYSPIRQASVVRKIPYWNVPSTKKHIQNEKEVIMNLTNLILWSLGVIIAWAGAHNIDSIQRTILKAQAQLIYKSRTETWGSPKFLIAKPTTIHQARSATN